MEAVSGELPAFSEYRYYADGLEWFLTSLCPSPFVQRVWISLEMKGIPYQYIEIDPYKKPQALLEVNPRGLVPALRHGEWGCYESTVIMEYVRNHPFSISKSFSIANPEL